MARAPKKRTFHEAGRTLTLHDRGTHHELRIGEVPILDLIASGEVAVIGREEGGENFVIATLGVGETVGEVALVLRRKANADVVAVHPTVTLHLPKEDFLGLIRDHSAILAGLYLCAVERDDETASVLAGSTVALVEDYDLV